MLKILPQVHSTNRGATKPSGGAINEDKDLDIEGPRRRERRRAAAAPEGLDGLVGVAA